MADDFTWSREKNIELAKVLESYPCLWDRDDEDFKNKDVKSVAFGEIAQKLNVSHSAAEARTKNIIGQFQREYKIEAGAAELIPCNGRKNRTRWFLFDHLKYLVKSVVSKCSIESTSCLENLLIEETEIERDYEYDKAMSEKSNSRLSRDFSPLDYKFSRRLKRNGVDPLSKIALSLGPCSSSKINEEDEWDLFGALVAKKIRALKTPFLRMQTENEINNILFRKQAEEAGFTVLTDFPDPVICRKPD